MLNLVKAYLTVEMSAKDFCEQVLNNDELIAFLQAHIPDSKKISDEAWESCPLNVRAFAYDHFDLRRTLSVGYYALTKVSRCSTAYSMLFELFRGELPDVEKSTYYKEIGQAAIEMVPEMLDSAEVGTLIFDIIASTGDLPKTKRKKAVREALDEAFQLKLLAKKPSWIQGSEWPMGTAGKPMRFVGQSKKKGELVEYTFEDVETLEKRTITQYY